MGPVGIELDSRGQKEVVVKSSRKNKQEESYAASQKKVGIDPSDDAAGQQKRLSFACRRCQRSQTTSKSSKGATTSVLGHFINTIYYYQHSKITYTLDIDQSRHVEPSHE